MAGGRAGHAGQLSGSLPAIRSVPRAPNHFERTGKLNPSQPCLNIDIKSAKLYTSLLLELFSALAIQSDSQAFSVISS